MPEIIEPLIAPIGLVAPGGTPYYPDNYTYDIAVGGMPFFLAASQNYPYKRETAPYRRTQIDQTREPGEQSLLGWWLRSQSSFHLGQGVKFQEPVQGDTVGYRYFKGAGVDPWTPGKVRLLRSVAEVEAVENPLLMGAVDSDGANCAFVASASDVTRYEEDGTSATITWGGTGTVLAMANDGDNYYIANATGIYRGPLTDITPGTLWHTWASTPTRVILAWIKQRLMAGVDNKIVEIVAGTGTVVYTSPASGWQWSGVADGPNAIYFSGYSGLTSTIIRINLDTDGTLPTLTQAVTAAELPGGEYITSIASYIGKYIAIGTNLGVRIGTIDTSGFASSGYITYGPLSVVTNGYDTVYDRNVDGSAVTGFTFDDRFVYATVSNYIENIDGTLSSGLIRIDLSREVSPGMFAWATDLRTMTTDIMLSVDNLGVTDRKIMATTAGVYFESDGQLVEHGYLQTGLIRYLTVEDKHFKLIKPRYVTPMTGDIELYSVLPNGTRTSIIVINNSVNPTADITTGINTPLESAGFIFELYRDADDDTKCSTFTGYQLKSLPAVRRARQLTIPLMNYDFEEDRYNAVTGYEGRAWDRVNQLESIESLGDQVLIQDFTTGETVQAVIESLQFVRMTPPERRYKGFGGILYITARTV